MHTHTQVLISSPSVKKIEMWIVIQLRRKYISEESKNIKSLLSSPSQQKKWRHSSFFQIDCRYVDSQLLHRSQIDRRYIADHQDGRTWHFRPARETTTMQPLLEQNLSLIILPLEKTSSASVQSNLSIKEEQNIRSALRYVLAKLPPQCQNQIARI